MPLYAYSRPSLQGRTLPVLIGLAKRLGREFTIDMLDDHGMNREILFGYLLAKRENLSQGE